ncbi:ATP-dependent helicase [bacterium]|nr:ATP-dependent helicase [bacterium]
MVLDLSGLNDAQRGAVTAERGMHLVIAGAGTGKTRTLTYRAAWLVDQGVSPSKILLLTFTNKAASSMMTQAGGLMGPEVQGLWGGTFHSIANRLIRQDGKVVGLDTTYSILDSEDQRDLVRATVRETLGKLDHFFPAPRVLVNIFSYAFNRGCSLERSLADKVPLAVDYIEKVESVRTAYEERKRAANCLDYDDLLIYWLRLLDDKDTWAEMGRRFTEVLVDEYQDTNTAQGEIVERIAQANGKRLMVVGDDCQSIYAFRGAHYQNILGFQDRYPEAKIHRLEENYRSTKQILDLANAVILNNPGQYHKTLRPARPTHGPRPKVQPLPNGMGEAAWIARQVVDAHQAGTPLERMAILYRSHSHSTFLQADLLKRNIPYEVRSGLRFFEQAHVKDVVAFLKILQNPDDEVAWTRVLGMCPGVGPKRASKVRAWVKGEERPFEKMADGASTAVLPPSVRSTWMRFESDIADLHRAHKNKKPLGDLVRMVARGVYSEYLETKYQNPRNRLQDLDQLGILADGYKTLSAFLSELILLGELYGTDLLKGGTDDRLVLSTIHRSKGLEWDLVWVVRTSEDAFPSPMGLKDEEGEEEERRIFYVAATRARRQLIFTYPLLGQEWGGAGQGGGGSIISRPSRFLTEGKDFVERVGRTRPSRPIW